MSVALKSDLHTIVRGHKVFVKQRASIFGLYAHPTNVAGSVFDAKTRSVLTSTLDHKKSGLSALARSQLCQAYYRLGSRPEIPEVQLVTCLPCPVPALGPGISFLMALIKSSFSVMINASRLGSQLFVNATHARVAGVWVSSESSHMPLMV